MKKTLVMKTNQLKKAIQLTLFWIAMMTTIIITKSTIKNIKNLYGSEKATNTVMTCFTDLIY